MLSINYEKIAGVPDFDSLELNSKSNKYVLLIPVINEGDRIINELRRAQKAKVGTIIDIVICDGGSDDGSLDDLSLLQSLNVNTILTKKGPGRQGAQLRMGIYWALNRNYQGIVTIDGNDKDSIEDVPEFIQKLDQGYDLVQGSRFIEGGEGINTPLVRDLSVRLIHAPVISLTAGQRYTDTTNAYRAYSRKYLSDPRVMPLRDIFQTYELLAYLSVRANQIGLKSTEVPVKRKYPAKGKTPTKISPLKGNLELLKILWHNYNGVYKPQI
ncbi:glycosyltransferase family 2 protein [Xylocopilactobacillus apis]|uniref:Glycosyltransferase 2-like domain-containing protein n=1 Tax=Xylocopilactobacillus apis TaxID=2932183 RepID=A0AAU9CZ23_9LACO|nr:glycosyltransferase family 2 protein [Xylocopilactobacillus apis]BDR56488.1 hypothetical protein KIMC2_10500 [Xylocopilactobacillus apis]